VVFDNNACYILCDWGAARWSGVLDKASVVGKVNDLEQYVIKVTPVQAPANAAPTRIAAKEELWHRRFNHFGREKLKRAAKMIDGMPLSVADAERVIGTVCVPCVDGEMIQSPSLRSSTATNKCELVHNDISGPFTESWGRFIYLMRELEDSTGFITATPIKTKEMAPDVLKPHIKQLETLTGIKVKRVRHHAAKKYVTMDVKACDEDKGITSGMTAPYKSQQNGKKERVKHTLMERVRAALLDAGAEDDLWAEALTSVAYVQNPSSKAGLDVTPLEALAGRRPNVAGFRVWGSRAWVLKPNKKQRELEQRTDVSRFVGNTVGGKANCILEDNTSQDFERRDVLMEENSAKGETSVFGPSAGPLITLEADADSVDGTRGKMDMLDAESERRDEYTPD